MIQKVPVVIPACEPDQRMLDLLAEMKDYPYGSVIIVNDGSSGEYDSLFAQAEEKGAVILRHRENQGKGAALKTGLRYVLAQDPEAAGVVTADCDGQHAASDILKTAEALLKEPDCLILGSRDFHGRNVPWQNRMGNEITAGLFSLICGVKGHDTQTGLRGIPYASLEDCLEIKENRFAYEMEMLVGYDRKKIREISIETIYDSARHHSSHFHMWKDSFRIYMVLLKKFFRFLLSSLPSAAADVGLFTLFEGMLKKFFPLMAVTIAAGQNLFFCRQRCDQPEGSVSE